MDDTDGRQAERVALSREVLLELTMRVNAMDLSSKGISVWVPEMNTNEPIRVTIAIDGRPLVLSGRVVRQFDSDGGAIWGLEFNSSENDESHRILSEFVDSQAS